MLSIATTRAASQTLALGANRTSTHLPPLVAPAYTRSVPFPSPLNVRSGIPRWQQPRARPIAGCQGSPTQAPADTWQAILTSITSDTVIIPPKDANPAAPSCLVVLFPGAFMPPKNYLGLANSINQEGSSSYHGQMNTWVAIAGGGSVPLYQFLGSLAGSAGNQIGGTCPSTIEDALQQFFDLSVKKAADMCSEHGFELQVSMAGRYENVVVAAHSAASLMVADLAFKRVAGYILLETGWSGKQSSHLERCTGWASATRPVLVLGGEMDGQMPVSSLVSEAAVCAWTAARQGAVYAATRKAFVLVPGLNHAHVCGVPSMAARGDCPSDTAPEAALARAARVITAFLAVTTSSRVTSESGASKAVDVMKAEVKASLHYMSAYAEAVGAGQLATSWEAGEKVDRATPGGNGYKAGAGPQLVASHIPDMAYPVAVSPNVGVVMTGGRVYGKDSAITPMQPLLGVWSVGPMSHGQSTTFPFAASKVEEEVGHMQATLARAARDSGLLPDAALDKLRIVVSVHPTLDGIMYSQPVLRHAPGGWIELTVHAFMYWPTLDKAPMDPAGIYGLSHNLWVKLKSAAGLVVELRDMLGLPPLPDEQCKGVHVSARQLNESTYQWALQAVPQDVLDRFKRRGVPLVFGDDNELQMAPVWVKDSRMMFDVKEAPGTAADTAGRVVTVTSAVLNSGLGVIPGKPMPLPAEPEGRKFWGGLYVKVMSRAQALEWVMVGGIRQAALPLEAGCKWGGVPAGSVAPTAAGAPPAA